MAKRKTTVVEEPVETLHREVLPNGNIKLTSIYGIMDIRNDIIYSEVVCKPRNERFFIEAPHD